MKTVHIQEEIHTALRLKAIHQHKTLEEITNEILSHSLNTTTHGA